MYKIIATPYLHFKGWELTTCTILGIRNICIQRWIFNWWSDDNWFVMDYSHILKSAYLCGGGSKLVSQSQRFAFICSKRTWLCVPTQPQMCGYRQNRVKICLNTRSQCLNINLLSSRPNRPLQVYSHVNQSDI